MMSSIWRHTALFAGLVAFSATIAAAGDPPFIGSWVSAPDPAGACSDHRNVMSISKDGVQHPAGIFQSHGHFERLASVTEQNGFYELLNEHGWLIFVLADVKPTQMTLITEDGGAYEYVRCPSVQAQEVQLAETTGRRVALVIGNSDYQSVPRLPNPLRDAATIADTLHQLGFADVMHLTDLSKPAMERALLDFSERAIGADWAVVYYAGHGMEMGGQNYLIPVDAQLRQDRHVRLETVSLEDVLDAAGSARQLRLVILDACRDNPFLVGMDRADATRSIGRGLARVEPEGGALVVYAARHGQIALDGDGANSPFVTALAKHLSVPGLEISLLFRRVRDEVVRATGGRQEPFTYGSLPAESLYFVAR
jgi:hypothetical protein